MPNILDATGLQTQSRAELVTYYTAMYQQIYGADINLASDTPDGQMMNIQIQAILDLLDLITQVYNSFDPDNAIGVILDQRIALNGIQRQAGSYTVTPITLINSATVNLYGLDQTAQDVFTISDSASNRWYLMQTYIGLTSGSHVLMFRAATIGKQLTTLGTIQTIVTAVPGVASVNNPSTYLSLGVNEESDALVKIRRQRSVSISSQGYSEGLKAALENLPGVTSANVYENDTDYMNFPDGTPGHTIWVVVAGSGLPADIAQTIYVKRNAGAGMRGIQTYNVLQADGTFFQVRWDNVTLQNVFIFMVVESLDGITPANIGLIRTQIPNYLKPTVNEGMNSNQIGTIVQEIDPNAIVTSVGFSTGLSQQLITENYEDAVSGSFKLDYNGVVTASFINWNDTAAVIQTKIRTLPGLSTAIVTNSGVNPIAILSVDLSTDPYYNVLALFKVVQSTLKKAGAIDLPLNVSLSGQNKINPTQKINQFLIQSSNIVIRPIYFYPSGASTSPGGTIQYFGAGGYGTYTFSIQSDSTGGATIGSSSGLYTAGPNSGVTYLRIRDQIGNTDVVVASVSVVV